MELLTTVLLSVIMLAASAQDSQSPLAPPTIGVFTSVYQESDISNPPGVFIPIASYLPDGWTKAELYEMGYSCGNKHKELSYTPEQDAYLDMLLKETFYSCTDTSANFRPKSKAQGDLICSAYLGLEGVFTSTLPESKNTEGFRSRVVSLVNDRTICGDMVPTTLKQSIRKHVEEHVLNLLVGKVNELEKSNNTSYEAPVFEEITECSLSTGWKALWVYLTVAYPKKARPSVDSFDGTTWKGYYYGLLNTQSENEPWILWEYADIDQDASHGKFKYHFWGVFDADKDGAPEFALKRTAHEYIDYQLSRIENGKIVPITVVSGAL